MRRSCNSLTSINSLTSHNSFNSTTSLSSIGSRTKIYNNRDFQRYIANMDEDIIRVSNHYYSFSEKYNNKINNIVNRYENRTNQLFMDLRHREVDYRRLNCKIDNILKNISTTTVYKVIDIDTEDIERRFRYTLFILYVYTFIVLGMVWNL
jgi:hypothetical protein